MANVLKQSGILGMKWGRRKAPETKAIIDAANKVLNNPKATKEELDKALLTIGIDSKSGKPVNVNGKALSNSIKERVAKALGLRKAPETKAIIDAADKVLNNPKATKEELDKALLTIGIDSKSGKQIRTKPVYDKDGNDVSVNPMARVFKKDKQSDKEFDAELKGESSASFLAKQKVEDLRIDKEVKQQTVALLATAGVILAVKYIVMKQITKAANEATLAKWGPELGQIFINARGH